MITEKRSWVATIIKISLICQVRTLIFLSFIIGYIWYISLKDFHLLTPVYEERERKRKRSLKKFDISSCWYFKSLSEPWFKCNVVIYEIHTYTYLRMNINIMRIVYHHDIKIRDLCLKLLLMCWEKQAALKIGHYIVKSMLTLTHKKILSKAEVRRIILFSVAFLSCKCIQNS